MEQIYRDRLERLHYVLTHIGEVEFLPMAKGKTAPSKFDLRVWGECGTTACAVGFAACDPVLRGQGLSLVPNPHGHLPFAPSFNGSFGWAAVNDFFGLQLAESEHLFSPGAYLLGDSKDQIEVAARIKRFL